MKRFFEMYARWSGRCYECNDSIEAGDKIVFDSKEKKTYCVECGKDILDAD